MKNNGVIATLKPELSAPDPSGGIPVVLEMTAKPGNYEVKAIVAQGSSTAERSLTYSVAAK